MTDDELYDAWKRQRRGAEPPADFASRVTEAVHAYDQRLARRLARGLLVLATSRLGRFGICTLALLLFAVRLASVLAIFLTDIPSLGE
jgi:hypothetical protein